MNFDEAERIQLIDISSEDDFLIDSHLDRTSFDLRLSVTVEPQNELELDSKSGLHPKVKERVSSLGKIERIINSNTECPARRSLAWDQSFFTSPGFLELDELCLVNQGFKTFEVSSSHNNNEAVKGSSHDNEAVKGKVCHGKGLTRKASIEAGSKQKSHSSMKTKLVSPSKMLSTQSSKRQQMTTGRSEGFAGVVAKSHLVKNTSSRNKSSRNMVQSSSASIAHTNKPPLQAIRKSVRIEDDLLTASVLNPQEIQGNKIRGKKEAGSQNSEALNFKDHRSSQQHRSCTKQNPLSTKTSSLHLPSQKIGFFDMKSETFTQDQGGVKHPDKGQRRNFQQSSKKQTHSLEFKEKENLNHPKDTVTKFELKKDNSPSHSQLVANGSSSSVHSGQCSSSSKKSVSKTLRSVGETMLSPIRAPRTPILSKLSPWKKSAAF